jgi:hypothetical protein
MTQHGRSFFYHSFPVLCYKKKKLSKKDPVCIWGHWSSSLDLTRLIIMKGGDLGQYWWVFVVNNVVGEKLSSDRECHHIYDIRQGLGLLSYNDHNTGMWQLHLQWMGIPSYGRYDLYTARICPGGNFFTALDAVCSAVWRAVPIGRSRSSWLGLGTRH